MGIIPLLSRLRRRERGLLFSTLLLLGTVAVCFQVIGSGVWNDYSGLKTHSVSTYWRKAMYNNWIRRAQSSNLEDSTAWTKSYTPQPWKVQYKGRANLNAFEDWCGRSIAELRKNPHFPLFPHSRSTVGKLAIAPRWTNYGLRIFGYLHPYTDGEYVFALSSEDNSELWLSTDDSPLNVKLLAWVGKTGSEWSAPGEFEKYAGQISRPVQLSGKRRYFFEVLHKQDDDGTDHVEVAWQLQGDGSEFTLIESRHISLYVDESPKLAGDVAHVPQTAASHQNTKPIRSTVDMLSKDPRDVLYQVPLINTKFLENVLPDCEYKPSYTIKDLPVGRYEGVVHVKMPFIYPNDHTRLTHMESENKCYYPKDIIKNSGLSGYMKQESTVAQENKDKSIRLMVDELVMNEEGKEITPDSQFRDDETDYESFAEKFRQILYSLPLQKNNARESGEPDNPVLSEKTIDENKEQKIVKRSLKVKDDDVDPGAHWKQTFQINPLYLRAHRSDAMEILCRIAGSLLMKSNEIPSVVKAFMEKLNQKNYGRFTLLQVVNVAKCSDQDRGSRYLLELLLKDIDGQHLRLSQYVFTSTQPEQGLCNPLGFSWNPAATVHIIVPVKNQARWVHVLISEMEKVFRETKDTNFNLIVTDYNSTDMDVEKALKESSLHRYQYLKLSGNFQRSAGLQAGVDLVEDIHDIVFLCDLHIVFPPTIIDSIRKHTVEGYMAYTPMVLRLDCGSPPEEARGFWEVDGYGLVGIYKSDLDAVGGMNTREYTDTWGGEDWELLDRILKGGLEVDRVYLRNFFHYYHSRRGMWNQKN